MHKRTNSLLIAIGLFAAISLPSCSSSNDKYSEACQALGAKCSNSAQFDQMIKKHILLELEQRDDLLASIANNINQDLKSHRKDKFLVDLNTHIERPSLSLEIRTLHQLNKQKIYATDVLLDGGKKTLSRIFGSGEFEIRTDSTPNKGFTALLSVCSKYPDKLCRVMLTGEIDAVRAMSGEDDYRWRGWVDVTGYSVQLVDKSDISEALYSKLLFGVHKEIRSGRSQVLNEFIKQFFLQAQAEQSSK